MKSPAEYLNYYIEELKWNIIPVKKDKRPVSDWKKYQTEKITVKEFQDLYLDARSKGIATTGMALVTGAISGVTVIDFDIGSQDIFQNIKTPCQKTGSGGRHYFFKYCNAVRQSANANSHIDIRNDGGYAVIPPSVSEKGSYEWIISPEECELAELPETFIQSYRGGIQKDHWSFDGMEEGNRNNNSKHVVGALIQSLRGNLDLAWIAFKSWNELNNPPIEEEQLRATFTWCANKDKFNNIIPEVKNRYSEMSDQEISTVVNREKIRTGIKGLDSMFPFPSGFYMIVANAGVGKGFFAFWLSRKFWENNRKKSVYFSLEMNEPLVRNRLLQAWSDLTQTEFENKGDYSNALNLMKQDVIIVDEFGASDSKVQTPENFEMLVGKYYQEGYRIFHFDHLHELEGANVNEKNQAVIEKWGKLFQNICKKYEDIWLFVFAQPNGNANEKKLLRRTDISGSKAITQKCEYFISLNRRVNTDQPEKSDRTVYVWVDKNRITANQYVGYSLYFAPTGNYFDNEDSFLSTRIFVGR